MKNLYTVVTTISESTNQSYTYDLKTQIISKEGRVSYKLPADCAKHLQARLAYLAVSNYTQDQINICVDSLLSCEYLQAHARAHFEKRASK